MCKFKRGEWELRLGGQNKDFVHLFWALGKVLQMESFLTYSSGLMCKQTECKRKTLLLLKKKKSHAPYLKSIYINSQNLDKSN